MSQKITNCKVLHEGFEVPVFQMNPLKNGSLKRRASGGDKAYACLVSNSYKLYFI